MIFPKLATRRLHTPHPDNAARIPAIPLSVMAKLLMTAFSLARIARSKITCGINLKQAKNKRRPLTLSKAVNGGMTKKTLIHGALRKHMA